MPIPFQVGLYRPVTDAMYRLTGGGHFSRDQPIHFEMVSFSGMPVTLSLEILHTSRKLIANFSSPSGSFVPEEVS